MEMFAAEGKVPYDSERKQKDYEIYLAFSVMGAKDLPCFSVMLKNDSDTHGFTLVGQAYVTSFLRALGVNRPPIFLRSNSAQFREICGRKVSCVLSEDGTSIDGLVIKEDKR